jgi:iron complex outermembrane recepter protein
VISDPSKKQEMKSSIVFLLISMIITGIYAQKGKNDAYKPFDSIQLREVVIAEVVPLNNKQVEKLYKTNSLATIDNVLARLDGVSLIKRGSYAMEPTINGFSGGQLNITIDGMKMFGACTDKMDPITSYVEPSNLKSITIQQGSGGCSAGSNIGGSMDMSFQEPCLHSGNPLYVSTSVGYESVSNGKTAIVSGGYAGRKWQAGLNASYRKNDSYTDGYGRVIPFTQYEKTNVHAVIKFIPDSINLLKADVLYDLALNVGYTSLPMDVSKARAYLFALEYRHTKRNSLVAKLYYNNILHIMDDSKRDSTFYVKDHNTGEKEKVYMRMDMPGKSSTLGAYVQSVIGLTSKSKLTLKVDNYTNHSLAEMTMYMHFPGKSPEAPMYLQTWPDMFRTVTGIYFQSTTLLSHCVTLNIGGRLDYNADILQSDLAREQFSVFNYQVPKSSDRFTKSLNLSARFCISRPVSIEAESGYSERIPTISELYGFYLFNAHDGYDYIGNPGIRTEKSVFARVGINMATSWLKVNLSESFNRVYDYILGVTDTTIPPMNFYTNGTRIYRNLNGANLWNSNLQVMVSPYKGISIYVLTKYTWGEMESGEVLPLIPPLNNVISVSYQPGSFGIQAENETALAQDRINVNFGRSQVSLTRSLI